MKKFVNCAKNRNVIYHRKTQNIMDVADKYKVNYRMDFMNKHGKRQNARSTFCEESK